MPCVRSASEVLVCGEVGSVFDILQRRVLELSIYMRAMQGMYWPAPLSACDYTIDRDRMICRSPGEVLGT